MKISIEKKLTVGGQQPLEQQSSGPVITFKVAGVKKRETELRKRETELLRKEARLQQMTSDLQRRTSEIEERLRGGVASKCVRPPRPTTRRCSWCQQAFMGIGGAKYCSQKHGIMAREDRKLKKSY